MNLSPIEKQQKLDEALSKRLFDNPTFRRTVTDNAYNKHGVFSLSGTHDNTLLWSHYADSHKGFCVGFDRDELQNYLKNLCTKQIKRVIAHYPVTYQDDYPLIIPKLEDDPEELMSVGLSTKSCDWEYEREERFIAMSESDLPLVVEENLFKVVILGAEMPQENREELLRLIRVRKSLVVVVQAIMREDSYGLRFERLD